DALGAASLWGGGCASWRRERGGRRGGPHRAVGPPPLFPILPQEVSRMKTIAFVRAAFAGATALGLLALAGSAYAGDCRSVKFHFKNEMSSRIKVRGVEIAGNDGTWTEDISNQEIDTNTHYTTNGRTLNQLDSGSTPAYMTVNFDKWDAPNNRWDSRSKRFDDRTACSDGKTYHFVMQ